MRSACTSEAAVMGQPDKLCDAVADRILDEALKQDETARVSCKTAAFGNRLVIFGELSAKASIDYRSAARSCLGEAGYTDPEPDFDPGRCKIEVSLQKQSEEIDRGIRRGAPMDSGAGGQATAFGFACDETESFMPLSVELARRLARRLDTVRKNRLLPYLLPDGTAQVTVEYEDYKPIRISSVILSARHRDVLSTERLRDELAEAVIHAALPEELLDTKTMVYINPTGLFLKGGPAGSAGISGRKPGGDTYGGAARHGGSLSGKDPTKMDKSGAYMARYLAKNLVAAKLASRCEIGLSYALGLAEPLAVTVNAFGTERRPLAELATLVKGMDLRPASIIRRFRLQTPFYEKLSCYGHFGENARDMPWEQTDLSF